jgi:hypothetical protein
MGDSTQGGFVNGEFYGFARVGFSFAGSKVIAFTSFEYDDGMELEEIYGANMAPLGFGEGKYSANFKLTVSKEDFDKVVKPALLEGGDGSLYGHKAFDAPCSYSKRDNKEIKTDTVKGVRIMKISHKTAEGDKSTMIDIEGKALGGIWRDGTKPVSTGG